MKQNAVNYAELIHSAPAGLKKAKRKGCLTPKNVLLFFLIETILFLVFGSLVQYALGFGGVAITEIAMLVLSVGFVLLMRADLREVFPVRKPRWSALGGTAILWMAAMLGVMITNLYLMYFFPEPYQALSDEDALFLEVPFLLQVLVVAVLPAVCEEALHRGVLQCGIGRGVKNIPLLSLIMGAIFAVFHLYPVKYPSMLILGGMMSYILAETGNMCYSSFLHFLNNLVALLADHLAGTVFAGNMLRAAAGLSGNTGALSQSIRPWDLGNALALLGVPIPLLFCIGRYLLLRGTAPVRPAFLPNGGAHPVLFSLILPMLAIAAAGLLIGLI